MAQVIETGNLADVICLLGKGCDINAPMAEAGWPPICCAVASRQQAIVDVLLKRGANPNRAVERGLAQGMVALDFCQDVPIAKMLLDAGARRDLMDRHGRTPLDWASSMARTDILALLTD